MKKILSFVIITVFMLSVVLTGCAGKPAAQNTGAPEATKVQETTNTPEATKATDATASPDAVKAVVYKDSPFLAGKGLPPVKDRLPKEPKLTNEMPEKFGYEIGTYGGTLRMVTPVVEWDADVFVMCNEPVLNTPGILGEEVTGNVFKSYEVSTDQKEFTFHMREGLKWSDAKPVTVDDVKFVVDDILLNKELTPIFPSWLNSGGTPDGKPMVFEVVDNYTFKIKFDLPYGGFPIRLAIKGWVGYSELLQPAHYLKQFHKKYAAAAELEAKIKEAKFKPGEWVNLFNAKDILNWSLTSSKAIGFPVLYPWMYVKKTETTAIYERNPYYFKVDKAGNQLPYIDGIISTVVQNTEIANLKMIAGEVDYSEETALNKLALYKENETKGGYITYLAKQHVTPSDVFLNLNYKDPIWRKVVQDVRFRKALNLALNRTEIIDSIYNGLAEPSKIIDSTFDVAAANKLLDEMGMKKGADGFRVGPDGKKFSIPFEVQAARPDMVPLTELVVEMWKTLGLDVSMKNIDGTLWGTRNAANELKATVMWSTTPLWYFQDWGQGMWAPLWNLWWTSNGKKGEEPPAEAKKFFKSIDDLLIVSTSDAMKKIDEVKASMKANIWYFVPIENVAQPMIVNAKLRNVVEKSALESRITEGKIIAWNFAGEQFFFQK